MLRRFIKLAMVALVISASAIFALAFPGHCTYLTVQASSATSFISDYQGDVKKAAAKYNLYGSVMMAQAALESGWGQSQLTQQANNFFGIKGAYNGQSVSMPTVEYNSNGQMENTTASFKKYPTAYASFADNGSTLRNGTSWDSKYYSGTWKENATTYSDAANALTGKYATAPDYGASLIKIIQQYGLDKTFGETTDQASSSSSDASTSSNATDSTSSSSSTSSSDSSNSVTTTTQDATPTLSSVKYYKASAAQSVPLSKKYANYYVYNHIKGSSANEKRYSWKSLGVKKRVTVYLDMRGVKKESSGNWYRFRFYPNSKSKRFWVYAPALQFSTIYTGATSGSLVPNKATNGLLYNHVLGSPLLAKKTAKISSLKSKTKYSVDQTALVKTATGQNVWYRIKIGKNKSWIEGVNVATFPEKVAKVDFTANKVISSAAKANYLYTDFSASGQFMKHYKLAQVKLTVGTKVKVDKMGYRINDKSIWYRIACPGSDAKYWVSSKFLS
ncbi:glycoside hydrolase family 73 protein [Lentilactobacillus hilgardii]|uniref:glycoside hydrolase family 73 protein n=1 Tax=Lentilactobacillus hilgardii TaxID=1588 RepID=UPI0021A6C9C0|nr:glucosaminidase domain-containing protein [Lentilactobacillus hilgardii]MCT3400114.1 muramidase [Lentilactobacillus hilgardii]